jgi:RHS repeat-associated protein
MRRTYDPYGGTSPSSSFAESQSFTGQRQDETGLFYLHARYYDPKLGKFLSPDPILGEGAVGLNRYAYAGNDPVNATDPSGLTIHRSGGGKDNDMSVTYSSNRMINIFHFRSNWAYKKFGTDIKTVCWERGGGAQCRERLRERRHDAVERYVDRQESRRLVDVYGRYLPFGGLHGVIVIRNGFDEVVAIMSLDAGPGSGSYGNGYQWGKEVYNDGADYSRYDTDRGSSLQYVSLRVGTVGFVAMQGHAVSLSQAYAMIASYNSTMAAINRNGGYVWGDSNLALHRALIAGGMPGVRALGTPSGNFWGGYDNRDPDHRKLDQRCTGTRFGPICSVGSFSQTPSQDNMGSSLWDHGNEALQLWAVFNLPP